MFGIDPLFFGILVALNLQTSFLTPPMAMSAYYLKGIAPPDVQLTRSSGGAALSCGMVLIAMVLMYTFPRSSSTCRRRSMARPAKARRAQAEGILALDALALRDRLASGALRAVDLVEACLARIDDARARGAGLGLARPRSRAARRPGGWTTGGGRGAPSARCTGCRSG